MAGRVPETSSETGMSLVQSLPSRQLCLVIKGLFKIPLVPLSVKAQCESKHVAVCSVDSPDAVKSTEADAPCGSDGSCPVHGEWRQPERLGELEAALRVELARAKSPDIITEFAHTCVRELMQELSEPRLHLHVHGLLSLMEAGMRPVPSRSADHFAELRAVHEQMKPHAALQATVAFDLAKVLLHNFDCKINAKNRTAMRHLLTQARLMWSRLHLKEQMAQRTFDAFVTWIYLTPLQSRSPAQSAVAINELSSLLNDCRSHNAETLNAMWLLAAAYQNSDQPGKAIPLLRQCVESDSSLTSNWTRLRYIKCLGTAYIALHLHLHAGLPGQSCLNSEQLDWAEACLRMYLDCMVRQPPSVLAASPREFQRALLDAYVQWADLCRIRLHAAAALRYYRVCLTQAWMSRQEQLDMVVKMKNVKFFTHWRHTTINARRHGGKIPAPCFYLKCPKSAIVIQEQRHPAVVAAPVGLERMMTSAGRRGRIVRCSKCVLVTYCSVACQQADWPVHVAYCTVSEVQEEPAGANANGLTIV